MELPTHPLIVENMHASVMVPISVNSITAPRAIVPRRAFKKSRRGCRTCKIRKVKVGLIDTRVLRNMLIHEPSVMRNTPCVEIAQDVSRASSVVTSTPLSRRRRTALRAHHLQEQDRQLSVRYYHPSPPIPRMKFEYWSFG